jgi:hypothetical protein
MFKSGSRLSAHVRENFPAKFETQCSIICGAFEWYTRRGDDDEEEAMRHSWCSCRSLVSWFPTSSLLFQCRMKLGNSSRGLAQDLSSGMKVFCLALPLATLGFQLRQVRLLIVPKRERGSRPPELDTFEPTK